ncbi:hypothetical protein OD91_0786 [Lutibacter sp. Hel_I_33_5]|uniref:DUF6503 family protein n=1 Tax=Lutibacter sp. Hel_I_33_5 TaxID=1566289 RepID=UPI0011AAAC93|nr:DUF6503 family protein [Lutibacter sp. Hel_I_33_5]TVZ55532.1 hypothetical protein OD91_0786 [Lutibacter sp. Hel_I_33_5]
MKRLFVLLLVTVLFSCKNDTKKEVKKENFPEVLSKVFTKHGGLDNWRNQKVISFNKGEEAHTVDLNSRKTTIHSPEYSLGYNGKEVWLMQKDSTSFKGNKGFYYNLYFYFYAMPFVLADDGIIYEEVTPITFEGKEYPGYKISYKANVGTSPDDNYFVYYNTETFQMEWLGYTVTYFSKKATTKANLIRYNSWENVNGFLLPKAITWYKKDENGQPTETSGKPVDFTLPLVSQGQLSDSFFEKPME